MFFLFFSCHKAHRLIGLVFLDGFYFEVRVAVAAVLAKFAFVLFAAWFTYFRHLSNFLSLSIEVLYHVPEIFSSVHGNFFAKTCSTAIYLKFSFILHLTYLLKYCIIKSIIWKATICHVDHCNCKWKGVTKKWWSAVHRTRFAQKDHRRKQEEIYVSLCTMEKPHRPPCSVLLNI